MGRFKFRQIKVGEWNWGRNNEFWQQRYGRNQPMIEEYETPRFQESISRGHHLLYPTYIDLHTVDNVCCVCQLGIEASDQLAQCPHCGAFGHRSHFVEWLRTRKTCPNCRGEIKP